MHMQQAVAQGDPDAMWSFAISLRTEWARALNDKPRSEKLLEEAAALGHVRAQHDVAFRLCESGSLEQFVWLRRAVIQVGRNGFWTLVRKVVGEVQMFHIDGTGGRIVFEIGFALARVDLSELRQGDLRTAMAYNTCVMWYRVWCKEAQRAMLCWRWLSKQFAVSKDIRVLIADLIWDERSAWSDRTKNLS